MSKNELINNDEDEKSQDKSDENVKRRLWYFLKKLRPRR